MREGDLRISLETEIESGDCRDHSLDAVALCPATRSRTFSKRVAHLGFSGSPHLSVVAKFPLASTNSVLARPLYFSGISTAWLAIHCHFPLRSIHVSVK